MSAACLTSHGIVTLSTQVSNKNLGYSTNIKSRTCTFDQYFHQVSFKHDPNASWNVVDDSQEPQEYGDPLVICVVKECSVVFFSGTGACKRWWCVETRVHPTKRI